MRRFGFSSLLAGLLAVLLVQPAAGADPTTKAPDFQEMYQLIKTHLPDVTDAELNQAAVQGLLTVFGARVSLVTNLVPENAVADTSLVRKAVFF